MKNYIANKLRLDAISGFMVFLVALPLSLGIAKASGFPPIAGVYAAVIGGIITTIISNSPLTIKGPAAGLIVIALNSVEELGKGDMIKGYKLTLAIIVLSGVLQILLGLLKAGKYSDFFPAAVIHGMLAAIGIIILVKQIHIALGVVPQSKETLDLIKEIPESLKNLNPEVALIGMLSLLILIALLVNKNQTIKKIPAPLIVLLFAIPLSLFFDLSHEHDYDIGTLHFHINPAQLLVALPDNFFSGITPPDFSEIFTYSSFKYMIMFALVGSIESLLSTKAIDTLDPKKRKTNMNRDLISVGIGNSISGLLGGLPMISEIVRSSANINAGAKSKMSNFFHGLFMFLFALLAASVIQKIPNAALAAMLIYTGYKLASPKEFINVLKIGGEQFLIFMLTLTITLLTDLLVGVVSGILLKLLIHIYHGANPITMFNFKFKMSERGNQLKIMVMDLAIFTNYLGFKKLINSIPRTKDITIDFSLSKIVDHSFLENIHLLHDEFSIAGGTIKEIGFEKHNYSSYHPYASRVLIKNPNFDTNSPANKLDRRQFTLNLLSAKYELDFVPNPSLSILKFGFGDHSLTRSIKYGKNLMIGKIDFYQIMLLDIEYEFYDGLTKENVTSTICVVRVTQDISVPNFLLEKHNFLSVIEMAKGYKDINFSTHEEFSKKYFLRGKDEDAVRQTFGHYNMLSFLSKNDNYSIECLNNIMLIHNYRKYLDIEGVKKMLNFCSEFSKLFAQKS